MKLTILMPCLNEERTLANCIEEATLYNPEAEILVADNGSTDKSVKIAEALGARVIHVKEKGYGNVLIAGIKAASGDFIVMADSDMSYNFGEAQAILSELENGNDLVMGNRFKGGIATGAMPFLHKYLGNPVLSWIGRFLFNLPIGDFHCGIRGIRKEKFGKIEFLSTGMEWASEMILRAGKEKMEISEIPATLRKDGRDRRPHLRTWRDGWRHLKILLLFSPKWLFNVPGAILTIGGGLTTTAILIGPVKINGLELDINTLLYTSSMILVGTQTLLLGKIAEEFGILGGMHPAKKKETAPMEWGMLAGILSIGVGLVLGVLGMNQWGNADFGGLDPQKTMRLVIPSALFLMIGVQLVFWSFIFGLIALLEQKKED